MTTADIIYLLLLALVNSFVIIGWNKATYFEWDEKQLKAYSVGERYFYANAKNAIIEKMIFWKLRYWSLKYVGEFLSKPLFTCPTCMASVHSFYIYWPVMLLSPFTLLQIALIYPVYILVLAGVASVVNNYA